MRRGLWIGFGALLATLGLSIVAAAVLLITEPGLRFGLEMAQRFAPGTFTWHDARGRLIGPLQIEGLEYTDASGRYTVARLAFDWSPGRLLARRLSIHQLHVEGVDIDLGGREPSAGSAAPIEPGWSLPFELVVRDLTVRDLRIRTAPAALLEIAALDAALASGLEWIDFEHLQVRIEPYVLDLQGRLGLGRTVASDLRLALQARPPGVEPVAASVQLQGTWERASAAVQVTAPAPLTAQLELVEPFAELRWALDAQLPVITLQRIAATWPELRAGGTLQASGGLHDVRVRADLQTDWEATDLYPLHLELTLDEDADGRLRLRPSTLVQGPAQLQLRGEWQPADGVFDLRLEATTLQWPPHGTPQVRVPTATVALTGQADDYRLEVSAQLQGPDFPATTLAGAGRGDREALTVERLRLDTLEGVVEGAGRLAWAPTLAWEAQLTAHDLDPGQQWPDWPGRLGAQVETRGTRTVDQPLELEAHIEALDGTLRGYPVGGAGRLELRGEQGRIEGVELRSGEAQFSAAGDFGTHWDLRWSLRAPDLAQLLPALAGRLEADGTLTGTRAAPRLTTRARAAALQAGDLRLERLDLDADLGLQPDAPLDLTLRGEALVFDGRRIDRFAADLDGSLQRHSLNLDAQGPTHALTLLAHGGWDGTVWDGRLQRADWRLPEAGAWALAGAVPLRLGAHAGAVHDLCWTQDRARLCVDLEQSAADRILRARLSDWPVDGAVAAWLPPEVRLDGVRLGLELEARKKMGMRDWGVGGWGWGVGIRDSGEGTLTVSATGRLSAGTLHWLAATGREDTAFGGADLDARLTAQGAQARAVVRLSGADQVVLDAALPGYRPGADLAAQPLEGRLTGAIRDLSLADGLLENIDQLSGVIAIDARLGGTPADPTLQGGLRLREGRAYIGPAGVQLEDLQLALTGDPAAATLQLEGDARSGPGTVAVEGRLSGLGRTDLEGRLRLTGEAFEAVNLPEARVLVTPDVTLAVRGRAVTVDGSVHIPEARLEPRDLSGAQTSSRDVVLVGQEAAPASPRWEVSTRVTVTLGDQVQFDGFGLKGRFTGTLEVIDEPGRVTRGRGELQVLDGVYSAYGQELKIETGRVLFRDGPIDDPGLDVRAVRRTGDVLAGVKVFGELRDPQVELYSQPTLPQADQLSYLLLGRPIEGASGSEGQLLMQAATSLGLKGGNLLAQTIGSSFGLDEVSVGGGNDLDSAALTVGKYLSPRLYINYSVGLIDAVNRLQLRYQLSRRFSVQTETGTATGGDILYTIER
ncbi:MAG: translocation/assembly module TamB domain-containing protein [Thiohalobacteraceae bacterium]